jgi:hypothetical protein
MRDILWAGVIENYIETGNIKKLAKLVRDSGVPPEHRDRVADILLGKLPPKKQTPDRHLESEYKLILSSIKSQNKFTDEMNSWFKVQIDIGLKKPYSKMTQQDVKRAISLSKNLGYGGRYETARRIINRKVKEKEWEAIPD